MKLSKFIMSTAMVVFIGCGTPYRATDTTVIVAPASVQTAFSAQYPTALNAAWTHFDPALTSPMDWEFADWQKLDAADYTVRFNMDNDDYYAWYDDAGNWIGTAYLVRNFNTLPSAVSNKIADLFPSYTIVSANKQFQKDRLAYDVVLKNGDSKVKLRLDGSGTILKQVDKSAD